MISTHTSLAGRDVARVDGGSVDVLISTHTSLAGRDTDHPWTCIKSIFLLTRPSRDVTFYNFIVMIPCVFLLTRPSRDVTCLQLVNQQQIRISTHTSLAGRDFNFVTDAAHEQDFYSHVPRGT